MWRSYDYEFKQENHVVHEKRSSWGTTYPSHEEHYYVPPPTMQKMVNNHPSSFHHENFDDSDDDDDSYHHHHHHQQHEHVGAVNNNRGFMIHHDHGNHNNWFGTHHVSNQRNADVKSRHHPGRILRPPVHQYYYPVDVDQRGNESYSRINNNNNRNRAMDDYYYSRNKFPHYGEVSRLEDDYGNNNEGIGEELDYNSLMKGMHNGGNKVKLIEMIEYERRTYRGAQQEWLVLGGSDSSYPNKYAPPNRVKGF